MGSRRPGVAIYLRVVTGTYVYCVWYERPSDPPPTSYVYYRMQRYLIEYGGIVDGVEVDREGREERRR